MLRRRVNYRRRRVLNGDREGPGRGVAVRIGGGERDGRRAEREVLPEAGTRVHRDTAVDEIRRRRGERDHGAGWRRGLDDDVGAANDDRRRRVAHGDREGPGRRVAVRVGGGERDGRRAERERAPRGRTRSSRRTLPSTRSVAVAVNSTTAPVGPVASATMLAGGLITGGVVSRTVTVKVLVAVLLCASVAVSVTVVVPSGKVLPEAGLAFTATLPSTRSVAVAVKFTAAPAALVASAVIFAGSEMTGGVVSCTMTNKVCLAVLPAASWRITKPRSSRAQTGCPKPASRSPAHSR